MIGKFTESKEFEHIRSHLMHGRIVYAFTGSSFILLHYNCNEEKGIMREFSITDNIEVNATQLSLMKLIEEIRTNLNNENYHYLLYYGELSADDSIYDFMREFYNPSEELPIIVATAMVDSDYIRNDVSYACNIQGRILKQIDEFNSKLMESHVNTCLSTKDSGVYSIFSIWLRKCENIFTVVFKSKFSDVIDVDEELSKYKQHMLEELNIEIKRLGVPV
jgi:hypothetical protein